MDNSVFAKLAGTNNNKLGHLATHLYGPDLYVSNLHEWKIPFSNMAKTKSENRPPPALDPARRAELSARVRLIPALTCIWRGVSRRPSSLPVAVHLKFVASIPANFTDRLPVFLVRSTHAYLRFQFHAGDSPAWISVYSAGAKLSAFILRV